MAALVETALHHQSPPDINQFPEITSYSGIRSLSIVGLLLKEMGKEPIMSVKEQKKHSATIFSSYFAIKTLTDLNHSGWLDSDWREPVEKLLANPTVQFIKNQFWNKEKLDPHKAHHQKLIRIIENHELWLRNFKSREIVPQEFVQHQVRLVQSGLESFDKTILANMRLAFSIAKKHQSYGLDLEDSLSHAHEGLMIATAKYYFGANFRFSTYATWWIRQAVKRGREESSHTIRIPVNVQEKLKKIKKSNPDDEQFLQAIQQARLTSAYNAMQTVSLNSPVGDDDSQLGDFVGEVDNSHDNLELIGLKEALADALSMLTPRQTLVLRLRFERSMTLDEAGRELCVTRERIRQIEAKALKKLRKLANITGLNHFRDYDPKAMPTNAAKEIVARHFS